MPLRDKVAIVTGAAQGIGRAIAAVLASEGASLAVCDLNLEKLSGALAGFQQASPNHRAYQVDVSNSAEVQSFVDTTVAFYGHIDILVNNAGIIIRNSVCDISSAEWDKVFDVNVKGPFLLTQAAARHMVAHKIAGNIVNIASTSAQYAQTNKATYATTKAALVHLTRCAAVELAPYGIRVNAICPGPTLTAQIADRISEEYLQGKGMVLDGVGMPEDTARAVLFVVSDAARRVSGAQLNIDSGQQLY
jgi:NAD(P)-dependent dehydrogenase (short-subunit alcohol dehydrogenase family)